MEESETAIAKRSVRAILHPMLLLAIVLLGVIWQRNNYIISKLYAPPEITFKKTVLFILFAVICLLEIGGIILSVKTKNGILNIIDSVALNFLPLFCMLTFNARAVVFAKIPDGESTWRMFGNFSSKTGAVAVFHASMALTVAVCLFRSYVRIIRFGSAGKECDRPLIFNPKAKINNFGYAYQFFVVTYHLIFALIALYSISTTAVYRVYIFIAYLVFHLLATIAFCCIHIKKTGKQYSLPKYGSIKRQ